MLAGRAIALMVACALVAASCAGTAVSSGPSARASSAASPSAGPTLGYACSLLTLEQVSTAIDFVVNKQLSDAGGLKCSWTYDDPNTMVGFNTAKLEIIDTATFSATQSNRAGGTEVTLVGRLGDPAFFVDRGSESTNLSVKRGDKAFTVSVLGIAYSTAQSESDEKTLAGYVLAQI